VNGTTLETFIRNAANCRLFLGSIPLNEGV
jgi:hypothetical protein